MTHPHVDNPGTDNPFEQPAAQSEGRMVFGALRVFTNKVNLVKGASYILDSLGIDPDPDSILNKLTDKNGNLWEFRGKQQAPNGSHTHVIVVITCRASDGHLYNNSRDFMYWDRDVAQRVTVPSLKKFFGSKMAGIWNKSAEVQAEVVEIDDKGYTRQAFKVIRVFKAVAEREAAETAFFSQFHQAEAQTPDQIADEMLGEDPIPFGNEEIKMSVEAARGLLKSLLVASGQDKDKVLAQVRPDASGDGGMPVVLAALKIDPSQLNNQVVIDRLFS